MGDFHKLKVWQRAHEHVLAVYRETASFPKSELYSLTAQLRRAAVSVAANIAEGCGRNGAREMARFVDIAQGSANEVDYLILVARDLEYLTTESWQKAEQALSETRRMLASLARTLRGTKRTRKSS
jgi:four helix bundle protein